MYLLNREMRAMDTAKTESAADNLQERRRQWEGIHDDEAAQYRLPLENTHPQECVAFCVLPGLSVIAVLLAVAYGFYKVIVILF